MTLRPELITQSLMDQWMAHAGSHVQGGTDFLTRAMTRSTASSQVDDFTNIWIVAFLTAFSLFLSAVRLIEAS